MAKPMAVLIQEVTGAEEGLVAVVAVSVVAEVEGAAQVEDSKKEGLI